MVEKLPDTNVTVPPTTSASGFGPLSGLTVVEFAGLSPASIAGMLLCGLGADVIRIDRKTHEADDARNTLRRGRRSVVLDLKSPDGLSAARRLVSQADVLIEAYRPGVMERLGLGPDDLEADNPGLIYGRLTGWGQEGPYAQMAGHDIAYLALTGALYTLGDGGSTPPPPINYVADLGAGTMFLLLGILSALHERQRSGRGQVVDAAMVDAVPTLAATVLRARAQGEWVDERGANYLDGGAPFYRTYACQGGGFIAVGAIEPHFYAQFVKGLGFEEAELSGQWDRNQWPALSQTFAARVSERSRAQWEEHFAGTDACVSPVLTFDEADKHPHMVSRKNFIEIDGSLQPGAAPHFSRTPVIPPVAVPDRGADTREVLDAAGFTAEEIDNLISRGVAFTPPA